MSYTNRHLSYLLASVGSAALFALGSATTLAAPAHNFAAAAPVDPLKSVSTALAKVHSFQIKYSAQSNQKPPAIEVTNYTVVRKSGLLIDRVMTLRPSGAGQTTIVEDVVLGTRVCERLAYQLPLLSNVSFSCKQNVATALGITAEVDPSRTFSGGNSTVHFAAKNGAAKTINGKMCTSFPFTLTASTSHSSGILYLDAKSSLPCELDATVVGPAIGPAPAGATQTLHAQWVWHNFNDMKLAMPATPKS